MEPEQNDPPISPEELTEGLRAELTKIQQSGDGWTITHVQLDGQPVKLPSTWSDNPRTDR